MQHTVFNIHLEEALARSEGDQVAEIDINGRFESISASSITIWTLGRNYVVQTPHHPALADILSLGVGWMAINAACTLLNGELHLRWCEIGF